MTGILSIVTSPLWAYVVLCALLAIDAFIPVLPTQAIMITSGVLAAQGELSLPTAIAVGAVGVLCGDLPWYAIGRLRPPPSPDPPRFARLARWTRGLRRPGPLVILLGRFVPGGRMAACFNAGRSRYPVRLFLGYEVSAALAWATYGGVVGHVGGAAVASSSWLLVAVAASGALLFASAGSLLALLGRAPSTSESDNKVPLL